MKHSLVLLLSSITCCGLVGPAPAQTIPRYNPAYQHPASRARVDQSGFWQGPAYAYPTTSVAAAPAMFNPPAVTAHPVPRNRPRQPREVVPHPVPNAQPSMGVNPNGQTIPYPGPYPNGPALVPNGPPNMGVNPNGQAVPCPGSYSCGSGLVPNGGANYDQGCMEETAATCEPPIAGPAWCGPRWYVGANGLIFTRNKPKFSQLSFDDTDPVGQVLSTDTGLGRWDGGPEVTLGWYFHENAALEATYWGIYGGSQQSTAYGSAIPGNLNSVFDFRTLNIGTDNVNDLYDAAAAHRVRRGYDVNNFELNFVQGRTPWTPCRNWQVSYLAGLRYMRFAEDFQYASADTVPIFGADPANEAYYDIGIANNLWGFQLGGRADWYWTPRFSLYAATKFGIYGNYMEHHSHIYNVNGTAVVGFGNPLAGQAYDIASDKTTTSFIGELDVGLSWRFACHWLATIGYRAIAISGLAYSTDQIPPSFADLPGVAAIDSNADMILHGAYAGVTLGW